VWKVDGSSREKSSFMKLGSRHFGAHSLNHSNYQDVPTNKLLADLGRMVVRNSTSFYCILHNSLLSLPWLLLTEEDKRKRQTGLKFSSLRCEPEPPEFKAEMLTSQMQHPILK
jgi:hypothetical protein